jgi:signal transduction histidine kinase
MRLRGISPAPSSPVAYASPATNAPQAAAAWLHSSEWQQVLACFGRATRLCVTTYDTEMRLCQTPIAAQPIASMLCAAGAWSPGGAALCWEQHLGRRCLNAGLPLWEQYQGALWTAALPVRANGADLGVVIFGWAVDQFLDLQGLERLAHSFGLEVQRFRQVVRAQAPTGRGKLQAMSELLAMSIANFISRRTAEAECRDALRLKDDFLTLVSHELRTPLASLLLRVQNMQRSGRISHPRDVKSLSVLERSVVTQEKLVNDLLDAAATVGGNFHVRRSPVDLRRILRETLDSAAPAVAAKRLDLVIDVVAQVEAVFGDAPRLKQALWNLVFNAIKFTPPRGAITVRLGETMDRVLIEVADTGCGIDGAFLPHLFERFSQLRPPMQSANCGLGLGLAITAHIVTMHGGTLDVTSPGLGQGSTFAVTLPKGGADNAPRGGPTWEAKLEEGRGGRD